MAELIKKRASEIRGKAVDAGFVNRLMEAEPVPKGASFNAWMHEQADELERKMIAANEKASAAVDEEVRRRKTAQRVPKQVPGAVRKAAEKLKQWDIETAVPEEDYVSEVARLGKRAAVKAGLASAWVAEKAVPVAKGAGRAAKGAAESAVRGAKKMPGKTKAALESVGGATIVSANYLKNVAAAARQNAAKLAPAEDYSRYMIPQQEVHRGESHEEHDGEQVKFKQAVRNSINHWWRREFRGEEIPVAEQKKESVMANISLALASGVAGLFGYRAVATLGAYAIQKSLIQEERELFKHHIGDKMRDKRIDESVEAALEKYLPKESEVTPEIAQAIRAAEAIMERVNTSKYLDDKKKQLMRERAAGLVRRVAAESEAARETALNDFYRLVDTMVTTKVNASRVLKDTASTFLMLESAHVLRAGVHGIGALADRFQRKYTETKQEGRDIDHAKEAARKTVIDGFGETWKGLTFTGTEKTGTAKALSFGKAAGNLMVAYGLGRTAYGEIIEGKGETWGEMTKTWDDLKHKSFFPQLFKRQKEVWDGMMGNQPAPVPIQHETVASLSAAEHPAAVVEHPVVPPDHAPAAEEAVAATAERVVMELDMPPVFTFTESTTAEQVQAHVNDLVQRFGGSQVVSGIGVEPHEGGFLVRLTRADGVAQPEVFHADQHFALTSQSKSAIERLLYPATAPTRLQASEIPEAARAYFARYGIKLRGDKLDLPDTDADITITDAEQLQFAPDGAGKMVVRVIDSGGFAHDVYLEGGKDVRIGDLVDAREHPLQGAYGMGDTLEYVSSEAVPTGAVGVPTEQLPHGARELVLGDDHATILKYRSDNGVLIQPQYKGNEVIVYDISGVDHTAAGDYVRLDAVKRSWFLGGDRSKELLNDAAPIAEDDYALLALERSGMAQSPLGKAIRESLIAKTEALRDKYGDNAIDPNLQHRIEALREQAKTEAAAAPADALESVRERADQAHKELEKSVAPVQSSGITAEKVTESPVTPQEEIPRGFEVISGNGLDIEHAHHQLKMNDGLAEVKLTFDEKGFQISGTGNRYGHYDMPALMQNIADGKIKSPIKDLNMLRVSAETGSGNIAILRKAVNVLEEKSETTSSEELARLKEILKYQEDSYEKSFGPGVLKKE